MRRALWTSASWVMALALVAVPADAVGTRAFTLDTLDRLSGGEMKGVSVGSDGVVRAGLTLGTSPVPDAQTVFAALRLKDGSTLLGTGPNGKVYRALGDQISVYAETGALAVTSLVETKGGVFAATIPDGKVFKLAPGKATLFTTIADASYVWALAADRAGSGMFAAVGPDGRVVRIEPSGATSVYFRTDEPHLVSLAVAENGDVYAGSSGKAILYRVTGPGRASVVQDFAGEEVKGIVAAKGGVFVIANEYGEPPEPPRRMPTASRVQPGPNASPRMKPGKGSLYRIDAQGRVERWMRHEEFHYMSLAVDEKGQPFVGTGAEGRVYTADDAHVVTLVADTDERQIGALIMGEGARSLAASDPPVFHRVLAQGGPDALWVSKVLDATLKARFGVLSWRSSGGLEFSTRSGNTASPDATWSAWSAAMRTPSTVASPAARFIQVRARWTGDPRASLSEVVVPFVTENVRAVVLEVNAQSKSAITKEPKDGVPSSGGEAPKRDASIRITWRVDNPDNDALRYRLAFKREGQNTWRDLLRAEDFVTKAEYDWDTQALAEGKYRVRVEAADDGANPADQAHRHAMESDPILVDNTAPQMPTLSLQGKRLRGRVTDGLGPIVRVDAALDGKAEWRPLSAADGVFDTADEGIDQDVSAWLSAGSHIVAVRAFDAAGNFVVREVESR